MDNVKRKNITFFSPKEEYIDWPDKLPYFFWDDFRSKSVAWLLSYFGRASYLDAIVKDIPTVTILKCWPKWPLDFYCYNLNYKLSSL